MTSDMTLDYYHQKFKVRVALQAAEQQTYDLTK